MAIHMGLVDAVLKFYGIEDKDIPIIRCPKCLTFWAVLLFLVLTRHNVVLSLATSFLASYVGIWLDLLLGKMDVWYEDIYKVKNPPRYTTRIIGSQRVRTVACPRCNK